MSKESNLFDYESLPPRRQPEAVDEDLFKRSSFGHSVEEFEAPVINANANNSEQPLPVEEKLPDKTATSKTESESKSAWILKSGHSLTFVGLFIFTCLVFFRPYEFSPSLQWLSKSAFWVALFTIVVFAISQLGLENRLTARPREVNLVLLLLVTALLSIPLALDQSRAWNAFSDFLKVVRFSSSWLTRFAPRSA
jgi:hypothetical protein